MAPTRWVIGLASGSCADEADAVLLAVEGVGLELRAEPVQVLHLPYGADLRDLIHHVETAGSCEVGQVGLLHRLLGETFAAAARGVADRASMSLQLVQCVGCPGHLAWHDTDGRFPSTLGLGMAAVVAERTGVTTVSDFRDRDIAAGGQGVPLAALSDHLLFGDARESRVVIHLGGTARVVYMPAGGQLADVVGFEPGPGNSLLDALVRLVTNGRECYDAGGRHAVQGKCIEPLLRDWLAHPYFQKRPPKTLPWRVFGEEFAAEAFRQARQTDAGPHDLLCTATHFVARVITTAVERFGPPDRPPQRVLLSGGGVRNGFLWRLLEQHFGNVAVERTDAWRIPAQVHQATAFGVLAALTLDGVAANVPSATGAAGPRLLGSLTPGSSSNWARALHWMAAQVAPPELALD
jgi:anhydro-N-acetylmuramic acid kinase